MITKTERTELRSIVRQQMRVLRDEVRQREAELRAEIHSQVTERFAEEDQGWAALMHRVHEITMEANRAINDALYEAGYQVKDRTERIWIQTPVMNQPQQKRRDLTQEAIARLNATVKAAELRLQRQEADLMRTLAIGALESEEARTFLDSIPTVSELVPATRLAELEASLKSDDTEEGAH